LAKDNVANVTLSNGREVRIKPVPPLIGDAIRAQIPLPVPPVIQINVPYGVEDWKNVEDPEYQAKLAETTLARKKKQWDVLFLLGIDEDPPEDGWEEPLEFLGFEVPVDKFARKIFWVRHVLICTHLDFMNLTESITALSMVSPEEVDAIADSFRGVLQGVKAKSRKK